MIGFPVSIIPMATLSGNVPRQPVHAAGRRHQPDARLGQAERGVLGGDDDVARERDLEPAAEREAVHRGDDRLPEIEARREAAEASLGTRGMPCSAVHLRSFPAEKAFSPAPVRMADPAVGVGREVVPHPVQLLVRGRVQRVHHLAGG